MELEERLDSRLTGDGPEESLGLAYRWKENRRAMEARAFDEVADQIERGMLKIRGVSEDSVVDRLRTRADGVRAGTDRHRRTRSRGFDVTSDV